MKFSTKIKIGTRGSALALKQANIVQQRLLENYPNLQTEIITIITTGDKILDKNLSDIGGKGLFIKEIEESLQNEQIDIAVHSLKDMPAIMPDIFEISCVLEREDARDAFVSNKYKSLMELPKGAIVGTSSARRGSQALNLRPDLKVVPLRGNINTRIQKLRNGEADATFLAMAGLIRAGLFDTQTMHPISIMEMLPAVSQGVIGIEILKSNNITRKLLEPLNHQPTFSCITAERSFMKIFEGSCTTPIAAYAEITGDDIYLRCLIAKPDGSFIHNTSVTCHVKDAIIAGKDCAYNLKNIAGENFFA